VESVSGFRFSAMFSVRNAALSTRSSAFSASSNETLAASASTRTNNSSYDERCDPV
jgi:hypothetical protein